MNAWPRAMKRERIPAAPSRQSLVPLDVPEGHLDAVIAAARASS